MKLYTYILLLACFSPCFVSCENAVDTQQKEQGKPSVKVGAEILLESHLHLLRDKKIGLLVNATSLIEDSIHLVDALLTAKQNIKLIFAPEHGFRGDKDPGELISDEVDPETGIPIISLYKSKNKRPSKTQLSQIDVLIFDIQDVGARFYTYISTLSYAMEACADAKIELIVLDRPNPNGWYVDGPVLEDQYKSFIGLHNIPIVHGMTIGEYAKMVNQEGWLPQGKKAALTVVPCKGYTHKMKWEQTGKKWISPSPNLSTTYAAYLYPILCWYEAMPVSVGRGTDNAFQIIGAPWHEGYLYQLKKDSVLKSPQPGKIRLYGLEMEYIRFTPRSIPGKSKYPKFENTECYGIKFLNQVGHEALFMAGLSLLQNFYLESRNVDLERPLFLDGFELRTGVKSLREDIIQGKKTEEIYHSWQQDIGKFKRIRKKYLLYEDFEP